MGAANISRGNVIFKDVKTDSRQVSPGTLFIAIPGAKVDGHDFIHEAKTRGAVGVVISRPIDTTLPTLLVPDTVLALGQLAKTYRQSFSIPLVALTGSAGKTTTKEMLTCILAEHGFVLSTQGNLNTEVGVPLTLLGLLPMHQYAVVEMGARKQGDIAYLMGLATPSVAIITNAGVAHQETFGSKAGIAKAKGEIFECLQSQGIAVINADDTYADYWRGLLKTGQRIISFGITHSADVFGKNIILEPTLSQFELNTDIGTITIQLQIPGLHMVQNAIAAAAAARALNIPLLKIKTGLEKFLPVAGRLQFKKGLNGVSIIDDTYNANPISIRAALTVLSKLPGKQIFVMGDMVEMGEDAEKLHHEMGLQAKSLGIDKMFGVGPMTALAIQAFGQNAMHFSDKSLLIQALNLEISSDTTILIKGSRFMRMEEVVFALTTDCQETHTC
ncbi:MAG: UDP-N-acetylmuramoyl-tripeptide--D-alanyl-D-alanine ligase [Gammaproteobacteria bacterium]|nr:UDP-N-acetylmuramoyl-tripeptide--D-alanyl-D-alanine ligase [Gammaproteobacteria bacterium]